MNMLKLNSNNYVTLHLVDDQKRPFVLIAPGGGYIRTSPREAEPIAKAFNEKGYHAGTIYYRESFLTHPQAVEELSGFMDLIVSMDLPIDQNALILCGFSSGGHYMANLGVHTEYHQKYKIKAMVLAYPVLTGQKGFAHEDSIRRLYGEITDETRLKFSLETKVTNTTPATFLFHTIDDETVKVENSLFFMEALRQHHVIVDCHLYHSGIHGLSLGTEEVPREEFASDPKGYAKIHSHNQTWFSLAISFLNKILESNSNE
ncbi:alpha/beta hydrolase [Acholeplasma vituli]|uniref:Alpha/beta hydrolase n=1 Tax=Paracholeplasma vituli TaxID=69473 RepID=A0ABT2PTV3_9MOLU|nr:alpha/beta hydrolase [Paracholeplasma vituli]MCU0104381.1 alpha/beta hydrolase [Paracholeplasma vituli]